MRLERVESVTRLGIITATGFKAAIGNKKFTVGEWVHTDGNMVFGHEPVQTRRPTLSPEALGVVLFVYEEESDPYANPYSNPYGGSTSENYLLWVNLKNFSTKKYKPISPSTWPNNTVIDFYYQGKEGYVYLQGRDTSRICNLDGKTYFSIGNGFYVDDVIMSGKDVYYSKDALSGDCIEVYKNNTLLFSKSADHPYLAGVAEQNVNEIYKNFSLPSGECAYEIYNQQPWTDLWGGYIKGDWVTVEDYIKFGEDRYPVHRLYECKKTHSTPMKPLEHPEIWSFLGYAAVRYYDGVDEGHYKKTIGVMKQVSSNNFPVWEIQQVKDVKYLSVHFGRVGSSGRRGYNVGFLADGSYYAEGFHMGVAVKQVVFKIGGKVVCSSDDKPFPIGSQSSGSVMPCVAEARQCETIVNGEQRALKTGGYKFVRNDKGQQLFDAWMEIVDMGAFMPVSPFYVFLTRKERRVKFYYPSMEIITVKDGYYLRESSYGTEILNSKEEVVGAFPFHPHTNIMKIHGVYNGLVLWSGRLTDEQTHDCLYTVDKEKNVRLIHEFRKDARVFGTAIEKETLKNIRRRYP